MLTVTSKAGQYLVQLQGLLLQSLLSRQLPPLLQVRLQHSKCSSLSRLSSLHCLEQQKSQQQSAATLLSHQLLLSSCQCQPGTAGVHAQRSNLSLLDLEMGLISKMLLTWPDVAGA